MALENDINNKISSYHAVTDSDSDSVHTHLSITQKTDESCHTFCEPAIGMRHVCIVLAHRILNSLAVI